MKRCTQLLIICLIIMTFMGCRNNTELTMVVGTYTSGTSEGIYTFRFNTDELTATPLSKTMVDNPSYLTISPDAKFVYAVSESGEENSAVSAFAFDKENGELNLLNRQKVGADPCYIILDAQRSFVATANYSGASMSIIKISEKGELLDTDDRRIFEGQGADSIRQTQPHLHCIAIAPDNRTAFATDLGTDRIYKFGIQSEIEKEASILTSSGGDFVGLTPRSGPRHLVFNRKGTFAYLINEISGMVTVFTVDAQNNLEQVQAILADTCYAEGSADIHLSPDEKFLYTSTRLQGDGIVIFRVNSDGTLARAGYHATGKHPRNFIITPDGNLMLVACKDAGMIQIFHIDKQTGQLTDTGKSISIDQPVCIKFVD